MRHRRNHDFFGAPVGLVVTVSREPRQTPPTRKATSGLDAEFTDSYSGREIDGCRHYGGLVLPSSVHTGHRGSGRAPARYADHVIEFRQLVGPWELVRATLRSHVVLGTDGGEPTLPVDYPQAVGTLVRRHADD